MSDAIGYIICLCLGSIAASLILITRVLREIRDEPRKGNR